MSDFVLTPIARDRLKDIALYTQARWGREQCASYIKKLDDCFHDLARQPNMGKIRYEIDADIRSFPVGSHVVFYMAEASRIIILNILHESMDPSLHI